MTAFVLNAIAIQIARSETSRVLRALGSTRRLVYNILWAARGDYFGQHEECCHKSLEIFNFSQIASTH
eukprot:6021066-Amphidinium_carterae.2